MAAGITAADTVEDMAIIISEPLRSESEADQAVERYADLVRRICFVRLNNLEDSEDVFQTVFLKYLLYPGTFESPEHEKAWFIRVTINACKDWRRRLLRRQSVPLDVLQEEAAEMPREDRELLEIVLALPEKYRDVIYLYYYEEYSAAEIGKLLGRGENTVYTWLSRARALLRDRLGGDWP